MVACPSSLCNRRRESTPAAIRRLAEKLALWHEDESVDRDSGASVRANLGSMEHYLDFVELPQVRDWREWKAQDLRRRKRWAGRVRAQALLDQQLKTNWVELLKSLAHQLNPWRESIFAAHPADYYWTCPESAWATDIVFGKAETLRRPMPILVRHSVNDLQSAGVMRYFGKKVNLSGEMPRLFRGTLPSDLKRREEEEPVKFRMNDKPAETNPERRRRSAAVSRKLRMLRAHSLIQKVPYTHRYNVTPAGRSVPV